MWSLQQLSEGLETKTEYNETRDEEMKPLQVCLKYED